MNTETFQGTVEVTKPIKKQKKKVASTSVTAFEGSAKQRATDCERIVIFVQQNPGSSREEIMNGTGIRLQSTTGNVSYLLKKGLIKERETKLQRGRHVGRLWPLP
jgi:predicted HTH transcriptional regulator